MVAMCSNVDLLHLCCLATSLRVEGAGLSISVSTHNLDNMTWLKRLRKIKVATKEKLSHLNK